MRIAFDGTTLRAGRTGVGYYTEHLLEELVECVAEDDLVVVSNRHVETAARLSPRILITGASWRVPRMAWLQLLAPGLLTRLRIDVAHFTNGMIPIVSPVPTVVTIHDMSLTMYPGYHPPRRVLLNRPFVDLSAQRADAIITVSESARQDIVRWYGVPPSRVFVVHEAAAPAFRPVTDAATLQRVRATYGLAERFILYVGTIEPRKNLPLLLDAFARRHRSGDLPHQLIVAGPYGWLCAHIERRIEQLGVKDAVRITGYVPFEDLPAIYSLAEMFVFPSVYEGFGLPVVEAMACGTPVVVADVAALAEVGGGAVARVRSFDAEALGDELVRLARDQDRRRHLATLGRARAQTFSWRRAALETLAVYRQVAAGRNSVPAASEGPSTLGRPVGRCASASAGGSQESWT